MLQRIRTTKDEGFTLIELLIVIIILGILAAIVVFAVGSTRSDSLTATCKTDLKSIQLAEESYKTHEGSYTTSQANLSDGTKYGLLKSWPDHDKLHFALGTDSSGYKVTVSGDVSGTATADATDAQVAAACD